MTKDIVLQTKSMIDSLKTVCANYGLGNASSEYRIITEVFLYKYLNDKFLFEVSKQHKELKEVKEAEKYIQSLEDDDFNEMTRRMPADTAIIHKDQLLSYLFNKKNSEDFAKLLDDTLVAISNNNIDIFSVSAGSSDKIMLFEPITDNVRDRNKRNDFARALIDRVSEFSFYDAFNEKYDFFATIFEYLISDYNKDSGKYAEYYTPNVIAKIIANIMVPDGEKNVTVYDPSAGSGTLLLAVAHKIGEDKCSIYSQDISEKSTEFIRLNLILNNLVHSLNNIAQGDTLLNPFHLNEQKNGIRKFDYIVSNPPFKMDFSDQRDTLAGDNYKERFFAGVPNIPKKKKEKMAIYLMFIQHIMSSLREKGKAAVVVPTGFLTATTRIEKTLRQRMVEDKILKGVISMPPNIFANTGTNVSVIFLDKERENEEVLFMDASKLGEKIKLDGKNQKTVLCSEEIERIEKVFNDSKVEDDFSVIVSYEEIKEKKYSFAAGQYFDVKIEYIDITKEEFENKMKDYTKTLEDYFKENNRLQEEIMNGLKKVKYE